MKKYLKIPAFLLVVMLVFTCTSPEGETNYTPSTYDIGSALTLTATPDFDVDGVTALETSFKANFTAPEDGTAYYAVFPGGSGTPSIEDIATQSTSSLGSGSVDLTAGATSFKVIDTDIEPGYTYDVHAVTVSTDGFAGNSIKVASYTTPDTTAPEFLNGDSAPAIADEVSFDETSFTFAFSEQVYYTGGDITFSAFFGGSPGEIVFTEENLSPSSAGGGTNITFTTDIMWAVFDAYLVSWEAGTFVDNVGLEVEELGGFGHFFYTRDYTFAEKIELNLTGLYDYTIDNQSAVPAVGDGQYTVVSDEDRITVFNGVSAVYDINNDHVMRVENDDDGDGVGFLFSVEIPQESVYTFTSGAQIYWHPYFNYLFTGVAGFYDFNTGEIIYLMDLADELGFNGSYLGYVEYNMLPAASRSSRPEGEGLRNHPVVKQFFEDMEAYKLSQGISPNTSFENVQLRN